MGDRREHQFLDFASRGQRAFRNHIVRVDELPALIKQYRHTDCYSTYFLYSADLANYVNSTGSISGWAGEPAYAHFLPLDLDSEDLSQAQRTAQDLCQFLLDGWGVPDTAITPYFSGKKGLHIYVATALFGIGAPSPVLPEVFRRLCSRLVEDAGVKYPETVDPIYDPTRLFRLPNTRHSRGSYKVPLLVHELFTCDPEEIRALAQRPRRLYLTDPSGLLPMYDVKPVPRGEAMYEECLEQIKRASGSQLPPPESFLRGADLTDAAEAFCDAELVLYYEAVPKGARSWTCLRLGARLKSAGYRESQATRLLREWSGRCQPPMEPVEAARIAHAAYSAESGYQFGCSTGSGDSLPLHSRLIREACPHSDRMACPTYTAFQTQRKQLNQKE